MSGMLRRMLVWQRLATLICGNLLPLLIWIWLSGLHILHNLVQISGYWQLQHLHFALRLEWVYLNVLLWIGLHLNKALNELLWGHTWRKLARLGQLKDLLLLLTLLNKHIVTSFRLGTSVLALHIFLKLLLVHNIFLCDNIRLNLGFFLACRLLFPFSVALFVASIRIRIFFLGLWFWQLICIHFEWFLSQLGLLFYCRLALERRVSWYNLFLFGFLLLLWSFFEDGNNFSDFLWF